MAQSRALGRLGFLAGILILAIGLSGCGAVNAFVKGERKAVASAGKPKAGECWTSTYANATRYADWGSKPPVDCSQAHQLVTFEVPTLEYVHSGKLYDSKGLIVNSVADDSYQTCYTAMGADFPEQLDPDELLTLIAFVPELAQWNSGARWVRCDVAVIAYGSLVSSPSLRDLPASLDALESAVNSSPGEFSFCTNDPGANSTPKGESAVYADCRGKPQWRLKGYDDAIYDAEAVIPYKQAVTAVYDHECKAKYSDKTHITYPYYPSEADWKADVGEIECWVGVK